MPEFFNVLPPQQALQVLLERLPPSAVVPAEIVPVEQALGRITAGATYSGETLPAFPRSTVDGFSLRAADTYGASEGLPAYFDLVGEVPMGQAAPVSVDVGQAATTYTGGMLAGNADAVVMVEHTQQVDGGVIEVVRPVAPGENVVQVGEDITPGELVLPSGHLLRPQDLGALTALGITQVRVARKPRVAILSMGDEVVAPHLEPGPGQIRDINTYTIGALVQQSGGAPIPLGIVRDDYHQQLAAARQGLEQADVLVFSAGSSVSIRDLTADIINALGEPGTLVHGLSLRPGKPAIVGLAQGKPAFGLPGNPVSAMIVFDLLVRPLLYRLCGCDSPPESSALVAQLSQDIASAPGREDYLPVRLVRLAPSAAKGGALAHASATGDGLVGKWLAEPIFGKSNLIFTLVGADGLAQVPLDRAGLYAGEDVLVRRF